MKKEVYDIVYLLKNDYDSEELRYSVRSVVKYFPYRKIVFVGGCPDYITADINIYDKQEGKNKWQKSQHSLKLALENDDLTENIWLFNDDFFVMDKIKEPTNYFNGTLEKRIFDLKAKHPKSSAYIRELESLKGKLTNMRKDTLSFAVHLPMLINRSKALLLLESQKVTMFRSYYGNFYEIDCVYHKDVKVYDNETILNTEFLSTSDEAFRDGQVGKFIRACFPDPCKYELQKEELNKQNEVYQPHERYTEDGDEILTI